MNTAPIIQFLLTRSSRNGKCRYIRQVRGRAKYHRRSPRLQKSTSMKRLLHVHTAPKLHLAVWALQRQKTTLPDPYLPVPVVIGDSASHVTSLCSFVSFHPQNNPGKRWPRPPSTNGTQGLMQTPCPEAWWCAHPPPYLRMQDPASAASDSQPFLGKGGHFLQSVHALPVCSARFCHVTFSDFPTQPGTR